MPGDCEDAGGLAAGSKVMFAGVEVGRVKTVGLTDDAKAEVVLLVKKDLELRQGVGRWCRPAWFRLA